MRSPPRKAIPVGDAGLVSDGFFTLARDCLKVRHGHQIAIFRVVFVFVVASVLSVAVELAAVVIGFQVIDAAVPFAGILVERSRPTAHLAPFLTSPFGYALPRTEHAPPIVLVDNGLPFRSNVRSWEPTR